MKYKFALFKYSTENIGDDIQSIAARRFLPSVDYRIDRDYMGEWVNPSENDVKIITNGWYMHRPYSWPIKEKSLKPLLVSMYVEQEDERVKSIFLSKDSRKFLKEYGEIGARDISTKSFFDKNYIDSYVSGCVTLTLQKDKKIKKQDFILVTDVSERIYEYIKKNTNKRVIYLSNSVSVKMDAEIRDEIAEMYLYLYQSASCVVTERIHTALPCLALETPVVLIKKSYPIGGNNNRLSGLGELTYSYTEDEFIEGDFDINNPKSNKEDYKKYRDSLIKKCSDFTGYNNEISFSRIDIGKRNLEDIINKIYHLSQINLKHLSVEASVSRYRLNQIDELNEIILRQQFELEKLMGIKASTRRLLGNIKRKINKVVVSREK